MPQPVSKSFSEQLADFERLVLATENLERDIAAVKREAQRLQVEAQEFLDKKKMLEILQHISQN